MKPDETFKRGVEVIVSALIRNNCGELLLVRQHQWTDVWTLPGGHLEPGETLEAGALREAEEETGLRLESAGLIDWGEMIDAKSLSRPVHFVYFDFVFDAQNSAVTPDESEIAEARWVALADLDDYKLPPGYRKTIDKYLSSLVAVKK
ncbi:MAG: NUDIX domain-containing protein [Pseudonocardiaceae bacterium]